MSRPFEIRYLKTAQKDLNNIFDYVMKDNPSAAVSQLEKFDQSISQLMLNPLLGVVPKDQRLKKLGYRMLIVGRHLVF
jgi:plasmid stabilization system protein ParE